MGNPPFEDVSPIKNWWFSSAMLVYQRVLGGIQFFHRKFPPQHRGLVEPWNHWEAAKLAKNMDAPVVEAVPEEVEVKLNRWAKLPRDSRFFPIQLG